MAWVGTYILDDAGNPVPEYDTKTWSLWFSGAVRRVANDDLGAAGRVSTVFLGLDHSFSPMHDPLTYRPILWETMVFGGPRDQDMRRYSSRDEAVLGHAEMVAECRQAVNELEKL